MSDSTALLVIDMQRALCSGEEAAHDIDGVTQRINDITARARAAGVPVFMIQHEESGGPLEHGSAGWQLWDALAVDSTDSKLRKTACDSFHRTPLHDELQRLGVRKVAVCGLQTEYCVDTTVRRALALGYEVVLVADAHSTIDNGVLKAPQTIAHHNQTLRFLSSFGPRVQVVPAADVQLAR